MRSRQHPRSVLIVTLDSCRFDTLEGAHCPNLKSVGELHEAMAPGNFTYSSHAAMFMGFMPGCADLAEPYVNPKFGKLIRVAGAGSGVSPPRFLLDGANIVDGFNRAGFLTLGTAAMNWFNPATLAGQQLGRDFQDFLFAPFSIRRQVAWLLERLEGADRPTFAFLNVGETHVPYHYEGASWSPDHNPCVPFSEANDADECRRRQTECLEFVDRSLAVLLESFADSHVVICADHGDCWGEDGLWEHGVHHEMVYRVPLLMSIPDDLA